MAFVISDDCVMCGTCAANCPAEAISEGNGKYVINADSCMECGTCTYVCPAKRPVTQTVRLAKDLLRKGGKKNG